MLARAPSSVFSGRPLTRRERLALTLLVGIACALGFWVVTQRVPAFVAKDFTYPWRAARALLAGQDPYVVMQPTGPYPYDSRFPYPIAAALVAVPLAWLSAALAGAAFVGLSGAALTWALTARGGGMGRLWMLASAPFAMALTLGQWAPLLIAGALLPAVAWALALKPTLGLALFAARPSRAALVGGAVLCGAGLLVLPAWPVEWVRAASFTVGHPPFVGQSWGWLPLLALLRWRDGDARLVAVLACVPQNPYFYDQLPLWLVARSGRAAAALTALSWIALAGAQATCTEPFYCGEAARPWVLWLLYVPATLLVLARAWPPRVIVPPAVPVPAVPDPVPSDPPTRPADPTRLTRPPTGAPRSPAPLASGHVSRPQAADRRR
jgi:hypothetical protein